MRRSLLAAGLLVLTVPPASASRLSKWWHCDVANDRKCGDGRSQPQAPSATSEPGAGQTQMSAEQAALVQQAQQTLQQAQQSSQAAINDAMAAARQALPGTTAPSSGGFGAMPPSGGGSASGPGRAAAGAGRGGGTMREEGGFSQGLAPAPGGPDAASGSAAKAIAASAPVIPPIADEKAGQGGRSGSLDTVAPLVGGSSDGRTSADIARDGLGKLRAGEAWGAVDDLRRAVELEPGSVETWTGLSEAYNRTNRYDQAEKAALEALKRDPNDVRALMSLAHAEFKQGKDAQALEHAKRAVDLDPKSADAWWEYGLILESTGRHEEALKALRRAAELDPFGYKDALDAFLAGGQLYDPYDKSTIPTHVGLRGLPPAAGAVALAAAALVLLVGLAAWLAGRRGRKSDFFKKYELVRTMGRGAMGELFEGFDRSLSRAVEIRKVAGPRDLRGLAAVRHPGIAEVYEVAADGKDLYIVGERLEGRTVAEVLSADGPLSLEQTLAILRPVCEALSYAHGQGLAHGSLSSAAIMVTVHGRVKLADFGLIEGARAADDGRALEETARVMLAGGASGAPLPPAVDALLRRLSPP